MNAVVFNRVIEADDWLSAMWRSTKRKEIDSMAGELYWWK